MWRDLFDSIEHAVLVRADAHPGVVRVNPTTNCGWRNQARGREKAAAKPIIRPKPWDD